VTQRSEREPGHPERQRGGGDEDHPLARGAGRCGNPAEGKGERREERAERPALGWGGHRPDDVILPASAIARLEDEMAWAQIQKSTEATWEDYETVSNAIGSDDDPPAGLIVHAAGEVDGKWQSVAVWESEEAYERFRDERVLPAVRQTLGDSAIEAGPPPMESFEVKHLVKR
jgi:hypothetical protein